MGLKQKDRAVGIINMKEKNLILCIWDFLIKQSIEFFYIKSDV